MPFFKNYRCRFFFLVVWILALSFALKTEAGIIGISDSWIEVKGLPDARNSHAVSEFNGSLYALGGFNSSGYSTNTVYKYDGTNWFLEVAELPAKIYALAASTFAGGLYAVGGQTSSVDSVTNVYRYDGTSWTEVTGLPVGMGYLGAATFNENLWTVGGQTNDGKYVTNVFCYNGSNWIETNGLPAARACHAVGVLNGSLYAVGGWNGSDTGKTNVYQYNGTNWTEVAGLPTNRWQMAVGVLNDALYSIGGRKGSTAKTNVYRYNGTNWTEVAGLPAARYSLGAAVLNGSLYAVGGRDSSSATNVYRYIPASSDGVLPSTGSVTGGYQVTISGSGLGGSDITNVTLCGFSAFSIDSKCATQVVVTAGAGAPGLGDVRVYSTSAGESVASNAFTYIGPVMTLLSTNGAAIASGASASSTLGTDFGSLAWGSALTNTFAITNSGSTNLTISGVTTNGAGAAAFSISDLGFSIDAGAISNFTIRFTPSNAGAYTAAVQIANNSTTTPYIVYLTGTGAKHDQTITNFTPTNGSAFITTSTVGLAAQASSGLTVTNFTVGSGLGSISGLTNLTFTGTGSVSIVASRAGDTNWNAAPSVTNTFNVLPAPIPPAQNGWVAIQVTPVSGTWQLTAPVGYTGPIAGTGNLTAASAVTGAYGIAYGALSGYVAPSNQSQFVTGGSTSIFTGVYLQISTNIGTPSGVSATEGSYTNKIRISWQSVAGATGYEIWRSQTNDANAAGRIADIPTGSSLLMKSGNTYTYDDYNINQIYAYYYWVRAKTGTLISPMSYVGMGYASLSPDQMQGTADIAVSDMVYLPVNVTNLSYAGTVSCRLANLGPDTLNAAGVAFDFQMGASAGAMVWIGSAQSNMTLSAGGEELIILTPSAKRGLTVRGDLSGVQQVKVVVRHLSTLNDPNLANNTTTAAGSVRIKTSGVNSPGRSFNDYDGDGKADGAIYCGSDGRWAVDLSAYRYQVWVVTEVGLAGLTSVPGDYDGDGITDMATYNRLNGWWTALLSSTEQTISGQFGGPEFTAVPCDFDGDAKTDPVVYREADGYWAGAASSRGYVSCYTSLGETGYQPVMADYDGDGLADPAVYNEESSLWGIALSGSGYQLMTGLFGGPGYLPTSADYDGDGLVDPAIYAPGTAYWQVLLSGSLETTGQYTWGGGVAGNINGIPVPADYDGDGKADLAVYHQDTGIWELFLSANGYQLVWGGFGGPEYQPVRE